MKCVKLPPDFLDDLVLWVLVAGLILSLLFTLESCRPVPLPTPASPPDAAAAQISEIAASTIATLPTPGVYDGSILLACVPACEALKAQGCIEADAGLCVVELSKMTENRAILLSPGRFLTCADLADAGDIRALMGGRCP